MDGLGHCDQVYDPAGRAAVEAYQAPECFDFLPGSYPDFSRSVHNFFSCSVHADDADIHLTRGTRGKPTEPKSYQLIFERGIDPDVDNPEKCHAHSEIPDEWPPLDEILDYQERVRSRVQSIMKTDGPQKNRLLAEALWIGFEHEAMHLETFLYMLLQSSKTLPPPGVSTPDFEGMALEARRNAKPNKWFSIPEQTFTIGLHDVDHSRVPDQSFGWDNEKPRRVVTVPAFEAQGRPITNGEYARYLEVNRIGAIPASWVGSQNGATNGHDINGESHASVDFISRFSVRTVFGAVPLVWALDWPVIASYDELAGYAKWMNCRLPTFEEVRSIYKYAACKDGIRLVARHARTVLYIHMSIDESELTHAIMNMIDQQWSHRLVLSRTQPSQAPSPRPPARTVLFPGHGDAGVYQSPRLQRRIQALAPYPRLPSGRQAGRTGRPGRRVGMD